jgi:hypothetical protein
MSDDTVSVSFRCSEELKRAIDELGHEARTSKSEIMRSILRRELIDSEADIPEHLITQLERNRAKERNGPTWQRIHFRSNTADRFRRAFEQGDLGGDGDLGDLAVDELVDIHTEEAEILFDDDSDAQAEAVEFVEAVGKHAKTAADKSEFDTLEPEEMFEQYGGVVEADVRESVDMDAVVDHAKEMLEDVSIQAADIGDRLKVQYDAVDDNIAEDAIDRAKERRHEEQLAKAEKRAQTELSNGLSESKTARKITREYTIVRSEANDIVNEVVDDMDTDTSDSNTPHGPDEVMNMPDNAAATDGGEQP